MSITAEFCEQIRASSEKAFPFIERCGVKTLAALPGYCHMRMPIESNRNHIGTMYAGALFTLAELPGGVIYLTSFDYRRFVPIVKNMAIRFRRPAGTDIEVEARLDAYEIARIETLAGKEGKCDFGWTLALKDTAGETVAIAECLYQLRKLATS